jgi:hypothetical protein
MYTVKTVESYRSGGKVRKIELVRYHGDDRVIANRMEFLCTPNYATVKSEIVDGNRITTIVINNVD